MLEKVRTPADAQARSWREDAAAVSQMVQADSHWRNLCGISWQMATFSGSQKLSDQLCRRAREVEARGFELDSRLLPPRMAVVAGVEVIEATFSFDTVNGPGVGVVRLVPSHGSEAAPTAWTISTLLDIERICEAKSNNHAAVSHHQDFAGPDWPDQRQAELAFETREPEVLVVGGGRAGICGLPAGRSRNVESTPDSSPCRSTPSRPAGWKRT
jgi:hypothetical protein